MDAGVRRTGLFLIYTLTVTGCGVELGVRLLAIAPPVPPQYVEYSADDILPFRPSVNDTWMQSGVGAEFEFEVRTHCCPKQDRLSLVTR